MAYYLLHYDLRPDYFEARGEYREEHLGLAREFAGRGVLRLAGAHEDVADGSHFVFRTDDPAQVEAFVAADPYVRAGIVTGWKILPWTVAVGADLE